jgi:putative nucleotidyltransferase-like protein
MRSESPLRDDGPAALAVDLLSPAGGRRKESDLHAGARRAIDLGLAGIFRMGLRERRTAGAGIAPLEEALIRAARREAAAHAASSRQAEEALRALREAGISPVVLKGAPLAERLWPRDWMRPPGDLDLLVEGRALGAALAGLVRAGYRPSSGDASGRFRPTLAGVELRPRAPGSRIDLHTRLFRSVGSGIPTDEVLRRARPARFGDLPIRILDPADEILHLAVHAAVHGCVHPKWILDLRFAALLYPGSAWREALARAVRARASRPFWAGVRLLRRPPAETPRETIRRIRPPLLSRAILHRLVVARVPPARPFPALLRAYALEWLLEERPSERSRRFRGFLERQFREALARLRSERRRAAVARTATHRWIEGSLRSGRSGPLWITLRGGSMAPALRDGDRLLAAPLPSGEAPREGAVVIASLPGGLVAHRIVARTREGVVTRGDACRRDDFPVPAGDILAEVIAVDPGGAGAIRPLDEVLPEVNATYPREVPCGRE